MRFGFFSCNLSFYSDTHSPTLLTIRPDYYAFSRSRLKTKQKFLIFLWVLIRFLRFLFFFVLFFLFDFSCLFSLKWVVGERCLHAFHIVDLTCAFVYIQIQLYFVDTKYLIKRISFFSIWFVYSDNFFFLLFDAPTDAILNVCLLTWWATQPHT